MLLGRSACAWIKTLTQAIVGYRWTGDTTPCTVNWCKKVRGAWLASSYCMGFHNFVVSNKIHPLRKYIYFHLFIIHTESKCTAFLVQTEHNYTSVCLPKPMSNAGLHVMSQFAICQLIVFIKISPESLHYPLWHSGPQPLINSYQNLLSPPRSSRYPLPMQI